MTLGPRKPPKRVTIRKPPKVRLPPIPTAAEIERAYEVIALYCVYGFEKRLPRSIGEFKNRVLSFIELARDDSEVIQEDCEQIIGELEELFLRVGGTMKELGEVDD